MYINDYGKSKAYYKAAQKDKFSAYVNHTDGRNNFYGQYDKRAEKSGKEERDTGEEEWEEKLRKWDEEMKRVREENRRERERMMEERFRKKRIQRKLMDKLALKKYLARQDEISQMNEKISLERAVGEDVYIEKAPLSKSLSVAEIMAICSKF